MHRFRRRNTRRIAYAAVAGLLSVALNAVPAQAAEATWSLINVNRGGSPSYQFGYGSTGCTGVTGDWDGNATTTVGVACPSGGAWRWSLIDLNRKGSPSVTPFAYGNSGCTPVTGDWDGDGSTTVGVACKSTSGWTWNLINGNRAGSPSITPFTFGSSACTPLTGDWDGNGSTTVGVACKSTTDWTWNLINANRSGSPSITPFGYGSSACTPVTGDWDGNATTTAGVACPSGTAWRWNLINGNRSGSPSITPFTYGNAGLAPVTGDWNGDGSTTVGVADTVTGSEPGPATVLWGVDSVTHIDAPPPKEDPNGPTFYEHIVSFYGQPEVFARYLGAGELSPSEVSFAHARNIRLLLIKKAGTTVTTGYTAGQARAGVAIQDAQTIGAPVGVALFIDLESGNSIDTGYIQGWYDAIVGAGYTPGYYGHTGTGQFNSAYCGAVAANSAIGRSIIWTPSPLPGPTKPEAKPAFAPNPPPCAARTDAWQYGFGTQDANGPNVDTDEFKSTIPMW